MPQKHTDDGRTYEVDGKQFVWTTVDDEQVTLPMRIKLKVIRSMSNVELDAEGMFKLLEALIPDRSEELDEMDLNDFSLMFKTWQAEYTALSGVSLGESAGSPT